jgi:dUTP pyrophosphatase
MVNMIKVKLINKSNNPNPSYETAGSAGVDLRAFTEEDIVIKPMERKMIHTGLYMQIPEGYEGSVRPRSGLAIKKGITVINTPGVCDSDYTGEICVLLVNLSEEDFVVKNGDRIAQMLFKQVERAIFADVKELDKTERGDGGFGHTGTK